MSELIDGLKAQGSIQSPEVEEVFRKLDRKYFVPEQELAYLDQPLPIGNGATISAPHMHAIALELLKNHLKSAAKCLDIGYGTGYMTAAMRLLMKDFQNAVVFGVDHVRDFLPRAEENLVNAGYEYYVMDYKVVFIAEDGRKGLKRQKPFSCIHVGAAFTEYPQDLEDQLARGGRMVVPVGSGYPQKLLVVDKDLDGKVSKKELTEVSFVPMIDLQSQCATCYETELERQRLIEEKNREREQDFDIDFNLDDL